MSGCIAKIFILPPSQLTVFFNIHVAYTRKKERKLHEIPFSHDVKCCMNNLFFVEFCTSFMKRPLTSNVRSEAQLGINFEVKIYFLVLQWRIKMKTQREREKCLIQID
jgi:hypothetical protein